MESYDSFMDRTYWDFCNEKVIVFKNKHKKDVECVWSVEKASQYCKYLQNNQKPLY